MPSYTPPLRDMQFVLHELLDVETQLQRAAAARRHRRRHHRLGARGRRQVLRRGAVPAQPGRRPRRLHLPGRRRGHDAERASRRPTRSSSRRGWPSLGCDPEFGGQGLPHVVHSAFMEMMNSANQAWTMYPGLSHGAYNALHAFGTPEQKKLYLPKLVSGEWTGTMCLTEAHCGTDLGTAAHARRAQRRRQLRDHRHQDLHLRRRARPGREHRAPGARAPAGRAGRHQGHLAVHRAQVPARRRRQRRRAQRRQVRLDRAQDGHPRQRHLRDQPRRRQAAGWSASRTRA